MARLTPAEWAAIRAAWQAASRKGTRWLTVAGGGSFTITAEAIRQRRRREGWRKHPPCATGSLEGQQAAIAQQRADLLYLRQALHRAMRITCNNALDQALLTLRLALATR